VKNDTFEARLCMATRIRDPFDQTNGSQSSAGGSSDGRISNVTSQTNSSSSRLVSLEVNRRAERGTMDTAQRVDAEPSLPNEPLPKRPRRTEVEPVVVPVIDIDMDEVGDDANDNDNNVMMVDENPVNPPRIDIISLVEQMETRQRSIGYRAIQLHVNQPYITEEEYLKSLPGHDIILCPPSDEEED